jgi:DNA (cytosine-5)-methyltransferase 1
VVDGVLRSGNKSEILHGVPFDTLSLGNIATPSEHNLTNQIWIQSLAGKYVSCPGGVWYELGRPAKEYARHWEAFEWLALLVKYVSDAIDISVEKREKVRLLFFKEEFLRVVKRLHGKNKAFKRWHAAYGKGPLPFGCVRMEN